MKILIINPPGRETSLPSNFPLGLGYVAKALQNDNHEVKVLDFDAIRESPTKFLSKEIMKEMIKINISDCDIVFIGGLTNSYIWIKWINKIIKEIIPNMKIVVGNTVASTIPEIALRYLNCDIAVRYEGEITGIELLNNLNNLKFVKGISYKKDGKIFHNQDREFIKDLDKVDFPAWDLFPINKYLENCDTASGTLRAMNVIAVRGCPFNCNYCCKTFGRKTRERSPENIIKEIKFLYDKYGVRYINFSDDHFTINKKFVIDFCKKLIESKINIKWSAAARVNTIDEEILFWMKKAKCNFIGYGVESGSQKILDNMNKMQTLEMIEKGFKISRKVGINEVGSLMIGYPGETRETINETVNFCIRNNIPGNFFYTTAYPGTKLYNDWKDKIIEKYGSEDKYLEALNNPNLKPLMNFTNMSDEELIKLKKWAENKLRKNIKLIIHRIFKYFKATGLQGFNKSAFIRMRMIIFGK